MPFEQTQKQTEIALHLPPPLYVLFVQANAYGEACGGYSGPVKMYWIEYKHRVSVNWFISISDKNLIVSISGDVDEAKALSKPPEDSQGHYIHTAEYTFIIHTFFLLLTAAQRFIKTFKISAFFFPTDDESDSDAEEEQEKTVSCTHTHPSSDTLLSLSYHIIVFIDNY